LAAYEYGAHKEDWKEINETHQARLERWSKVVSEELRGKMSSSPPQKKKTVAGRKPKEDKKSSDSLKKNEKREGGTRKKAPSVAMTVNASEISGFSGEGIASDTVTLRHVSVPTSIVNDTDTSMVCIMCQERRADIVFEPCHHCVLCSSCSETMCRTFCPSCRTTIIGRLRPSSIRVIRPRIYSSYSFM